MMFWFFTALTGWMGLPEEARDVNKIEIIAHRGESADAPENTMAAFLLAWERDVEAIELDVHLTRDGRLVVIHDPDTMRTTGVPMTVKESTLEELQRLDAGNWKGPEWEGEKLPELSEVLATIPEGKRCFIEIKVGPEAVPETIRAIEASGKAPEQLVIISFNVDTIAEAKRCLPEIPAYYLSSFHQGWYNSDWMPTAESLIETAEQINADALNVSYRGPIDREFVEKIKKAGYDFYVWTVDDAEEARRLIEIGVDGITTNKAQWLREQLLKD
ncbi:glycerophosphodiester phosphodiesterase [soil metagenome]